MAHLAKPDVAAALEKNVGSGVRRAVGGAHLPPVSPAATAVGAPAFARAAAPATVAGAPAVRSAAGTLHGPTGMPVTEVNHNSGPVYKGMLQHSGSRPLPARNGRVLSPAEAARHSKPTVASPVSPALGPQDPVQMSGQGHYLL